MNTGKTLDREEVDDNEGNARINEEFTYLSHDEAEEDDSAGRSKPPVPKAKKLNPFMIQKTGNTPMKRKSVTEDLTENLKYSPSPKKPALSVSRFLYL